MNIHEYQAKALLREFGVPVPLGEPAFSPREAREAAKRIQKESGNRVVVVKSQIHAGGRGAGRFASDPKGKGGIRVIASGSLDEVEESARAMLGHRLITKQTGPEGREVRRLYIEAGGEIAQELYLAILIDRDTTRVSVIASTEGGMDIEEVARTSPERILKVSVDPASGFLPFHARQLAFGLGFKGSTFKSAVNLVAALYEAFFALDASLVEINPLVVTGAGEVIALDAKMNFDDNALFRQPGIIALRDEDEEDPQENEAARFDLSYIKLEGNIGCLVNGAGLAMATMDIIKLYGAEPANFLDVGGGASAEKVTAAFKIILSDPAVKGILVNIFGGIMRCDTIAKGVIAAAREVDLSVPLVVRLEGTKVAEGKDLLENSGLPILSAANLDEAAEKVVKAVNAVGEQT